MTGIETPTARTVGFKRGLVSVTRLAEQSSKREQILDGLWAVRNSAETAVQFVDRAMAILNEESFKEVTTRNSTFGQLLVSELKQWVALRLLLAAGASDSKLQTKAKQLRTLFQDEQVALQVAA